MLLYEDGCHFILELGKDSRQVQVRPGHGDISKAGMGPGIATEYDMSLDYEPPHESFFSRTKYTRSIKAAPRNILLNKLAFLNLMRD